MDLLNEIQDLTGLHFPKVDRRFLLCSLVFVLAAGVCLLFACVNLIGVWPRLCCCICRPRNKSRWLNLVISVILMTNIGIYSYFVWFMVLPDIDLQSE